MLFPLLLYSKDIKTMYFNTEGKDTDRPKERERPKLSHLTVPPLRVYRAWNFVWGQL